MFGSAKQEEKPQMTMFGSGAAAAVASADDDMFGGMQTNFATNEDPFAGLGNKLGGNTSNAAMNINMATSNESPFGFMNSNDNNTANSNTTAQMFQGFGASQTQPVGNNQQTTGKKDDPFAGLF